jgi:hypothetical protein
LYGGGGGGQSNDTQNTPGCDGGGGAIVIIPSSAAELITDDIQELVALASSISLITSDRSVSVTSTTNLDNFTDALPGTVIYVVETSLPYIRKSDDSWVIIDPLLQPPSLTALPNAYAWGRNAFGQIGDNTTINKSSPVSVVGGYTDWIQVSVGGRHTLGVRANGTAWATGSSGGGRLGDNSTVSKSSPVSVVGGFTDWVQLSAGADHSLGIRANGTAWGWGVNGSGRLGDDTTTAKSSPVSVIGGFTDWVQLSAGDGHNLGVRANGTAWAWGIATNGVLGDGTTNGKSSPVSVIGGFTDWVQVSAGVSHSLGLRVNTP